MVRCKATPPVFIVITIIYHFEISGKGKMRQKDTQLPYKNTVTNWYWYPFACYCLKYNHIYLERVWAIKYPAKLRSFITKAKIDRIGGRN